MKFLMERDPIFTHTKWDGEQEIDCYEPGPLRYYINGIEVPEDEYEYFYNEAWNDGHKEIT
jgi:hypothetical protein